jgi:putative mRNA 3-end processing factor
VKRRKAIVEWREGVHILGTPLWCDARHTREACFVSSARVPGARRHRQVLATDVTLKLLPDSDRALHSTLAVPLRKPFTLGTLRLQLFPSGFMPGAASLISEASGVKLIYAGVVNPKGQLCEVRKADVLVVDASFAAPRFRFPPPADMLAEAKAWTERVVSEGGTPVLLGEPLGAALALVGVLTVPVVAHRSITAAARKLGLPVPRRLAGAPPAGSAVLWPVGARESLSGLRRARVALVDPRAQDAAFASPLALDAAFPWSDHPDSETLAAYIQQTEATEIHVTNASPDTARSLGAQPLGQLGLFS